MDLAIEICRIMIRAFIGAFFLAFNFELCDTLIEAGLGLEEWVFKIENLQKKINWFNTIFLATMFLITID